MSFDFSCMFMLYCQSPFTFLYNNFSAIYINYISNPLCNGTIVYYIIITCSVSFNILVTIVQTRLNNKIKLPDYIFFFLCHMRSCSVYSMLKFFNNDSMHKEINVNNRLCKLSSYFILIRNIRKYYNFVLVI